MCDALESQNRKYGASGKTFDNISLLRKADTVAVLTGQQAGLFTGPLYTIYKALSAIKMAQCLQGRGINAVPVFWAATEDHDFDEVSTAAVIGAGGKLSTTRYEPQTSYRGKPVGAIEIDGKIENSARTLFDSMPSTEFPIA